MSPEIAIEYLKNVISSNLELKHYKRRCELASEYYDYYTGNLDKRLQRIISRESEIEFNQRISLTNHITKSVLNSTKLPFQKAARKQPLVSKIDFDSSNAETKAKDVQDFMSKYNGDKSLDQFLEQMMIEYNFIDPNAFLIVEFQPNSELEKAKPYPFIAHSSQVIDYNYINGIIEYVIVKLPIKYKDGDKSKDGFKFTMYNGNETIVFTEVSKEERHEGVEYFTVNDKKYKVEKFQVKSETDPELVPAAIQFGYIPDPETNFETYLSIFDCALPLLRKTLKTNSELDQSMAMMAFPQRYRYVPACNAEMCNKGKMPDGSDCPSCGGTGKAKVHKGAQDIMELDLPKSPEEMFNLDGLSVTKTPPIELLTFLKEYINQLKVDIHTAIFNSDVFTKPTVATTATEKILDTDNMNDTLYSFCRRYSQIWSHNVYYIAIFTDNVTTKDGNPDIIITHKFPNDLKLKSLNELMADLKSAYDSKASVSTISAIEDDINEILYSDRPEELKKIKVQQMFNPFKGYSPDDIRYFFASGLTTKFNQILYSNYANIWLDLEKTVAPWIYDMEQSKIWDLVKKKVEEITQSIEAEKPKEVQRLDLFGIKKDDINTNLSVIYDDQIHLNFKSNKKGVLNKNNTLVVPVTLMVEGVHNGSHGPILHKINELGKVPSSWDGIPITIGHPKQEDKYISANKPELIDLAIGRVYNTRVEGEKLISEAWINKSMINEELLNKIEQGEEIEVSIGAYPEYREEEGFYNDEFYESIAVNYRPDHLAVLIDQQGACSCKDKCGINVNGGEGSGNFDHEGRPGEVGGSAPSEDKLQGKNESEKKVSLIDILDKSQLTYSLHTSFKNDSHYWQVEGNAYRVSDHTKPKGMMGSETYKPGENDFRSYDEFYTHLKKKHDLSDKSKLESDYKIKSKKSVIRTEQGWFKTPNGAVFDTEENALKYMWRNKMK